MREGRSSMREGGHKRDGRFKRREEGIARRKEGLKGRREGLEAPSVSRPPLVLLQRVFSPDIEGKRSLVA